MTTDAEHPELESTNEETLARHKKMAEMLNAKRLLDWSDWATFIYDSKCLTPDGQRVALWAMDILQQTLGARVASTAHPIFFSTSWVTNDVPWIYANLFQLAAQVVLVQSSEGWSKIQKIMRTDLRSVSWVHSLLQLEVAGLGLRAGWQIKFEPSHDTGRKADVLLIKESTKLLVETKSMQVSSNERLADAFFHRMVWRLRSLEWKHTVHITGSIGHFLSPRDETRWLQEIEKVALDTAQDGVTRVVPGQKKGRLEISKKETKPEINGLEGALTETDVGQRLIEQLGGKSEQATGAEPVWVRLNEYAGLWQSTPLQEATLPEKLDALTSFLQSALAFFPNLAGVILSPALLWAGGIPPETLSTRIERNGGIAIRCPIPGHRVRESIIIARAGQIHEHAGIFADWYNQEATWLDWALVHLGHPPFSALVYLNSSSE